MSHRPLSLIAQDSSKEICRDGLILSKMSDPLVNLDTYPLTRESLAMFFLPAHTDSPQQSLVFSASDLCTAAVCEYSTLQTLDEKLGRRPRANFADDALLERTSVLGDEHEHRILQKFKEQFGAWNPETGTGVYEVEPAQSYTAQALEAKHRETLEVLRAGADVVFQASFFDGEFHGRADFLVRTGQAEYAVYDTKLARHAKVTALLQLAAYADQLQRAGIAVSPSAVLILGNEEESAHDIFQIMPVYRERRAHFVRLVAAHSAPDTAPLEWFGNDSVVRCGRCERCAAEIVQNRDMLLVAGMSVRARNSIATRFGIRTIDQLARLEPERNFLPASVQKLKDQAALQIGLAEPDGSTTYLKNGEYHTVSYSILPQNTLGSLPRANPGDIFFDFEGDPLWQDSDGSWGLEYLFGLVETPATMEATPAFIPFWAHSRAQERAALIAFLNYVRERRAQYPGMKIYHYANYEKRALRSLAAQHGVGEETVDELLRENVLIDLYDVVRHSLRISENSYSIKKLEPLYMGDDLRSGEVTDAGASVVAYAQYCQARDTEQNDLAEHILGSISDYNQYDCVSTLRLRNWLLQLAQRSAQEEIERPLSTASTDETVQELLEAAGKDREEASEAETALVEFVESLDVDTELSADDQAIAMVASATGYHRRERKQYWWEHFDRLSSAVQEWEETRNVAIFERVDVVEDWGKDPERPRALPTRLLGVRARVAEGSSLKEGESGLYLMYQDDFPPHVEAKLQEQAEKFAASNDGVVPDVLRAGDFRGTIEEIEGNSDGTMNLKIRESLPKGAEEFSQLPMALTPAQPLQTKAQEQSLQNLAEQVGALLPDIPDAPELDLLRRRAPQLAPGAVLERPDVAQHGSFATIEAIYAAVSSLNNSYVAVQGPPGSGKTFLGSHVIGRLIRDGWKIGVVAQSHAVVENVLAGCIEKGGVKPEQVAKFVKKTKMPNAPWIEVDQAALETALTEAAGFLIGGTAWDFASEKKFGDRALDLLVIDEAGQYSLANTLAVARAAKNMLLLGDPQQLPQVTQGTHPYPVDESALGWLSAGHDTLPEEFGYFLDVSWRMHPDLCAPVSLLSYAGKLKSAPAGGHRSLLGWEPGLYLREVEHQGNTTSSIEEANEVVRLAEQFIGAQWIEDLEKPQDARALEPADILVVAAYNAQVDLIAQKLSDAHLLDADGGVRVGTVDKFQGQEAPVVLVSMAASSAGDSARGAEFLLSPNRLNVAISRGQWCAVLIASENLTNFLPATPAGLAQLGGFVRLKENAMGYPQRDESYTQAP